MAVRCYYKILGVPKNVNVKALKRAYRKAALKWHPDKNGSSKEAEANFKDINEAYEVLSDPDKRQIYDMYGEQGLKGGVPPQGNGAGNPFAGGAGSSFQFSPSDAQSIFAQFFGGMGGMGGGIGGGGKKRKMSPDDDLSSLFGNLGGMGFGGGGFGGQGMGGMPFQQMQGQHFDFGGVGGMPFGQQQQQQYQGCQRDDPSVIPPNTLVTIDGLSKTQYNGKRARISSFDPARGRYVCQLQNGHEISLRPVNFQQVIDHVRVVGLRSRPALNGEKGTLVSFNRANGRHVVKLPQGQIEIQPDNLRLPSNTRVRIHGLVSAAKYNNLYGKVVEFDSARGRYTVLLSDGGKLNVKPANLRV